MALTLFLFAGSAAGKIGLVFAALGVCEVGAVVLVDGQTEAAFETAYMVFEEVGIFFEVDVFERQFAESFAPVGVGGGMGSNSSAAEFGACAILLENG